eukprot:gnl/TRDRNA2_/TRDRNA2_91460_c0_seq1.p1 gnl/TRDRNA2_/TRDRNA2_91460_c0~~gnl/TRDRNA2_/TRDRNA2_91460_c0_seq1.p1  ORF type:complete len:403 (-),score=57.84 gnl/TRDRNA2_/TRDRNA2_91460_c0_seq1:60-1268(-)
MALRQLVVNRSSQLSLHLRRSPAALLPLQVICFKRFTSEEQLRRLMMGVAACTAVVMSLRRDQDTIDCEMVKGGSKVDELGPRWQPPEIIRGSQAAGSRVYKRGRRLGAGLCGVAYQYEDQSNSKSVCIKFPRKVYAEAERTAFVISRRINPEMLYTNHLSPAYELLELPMADVAGGVAQVWGWGGEKTLWEFVTSGDLLTAPVGHVRTPNPPVLARSILEHMLLGLEQLHAAGHIHGDLHADNVMVHLGRRGWWVNLIDFGMCRPIGRKWATFCGPGTDFDLSQPIGRKFSQWPPELWTQYIRLSKGEKMQWQHLETHASFDIWSAGLLYYGMVGILSYKPGRPNPDQLVASLADLIEKADGETSAARAALADATDDLPPADRMLLRMMLDPSPERRPAAA